MESCPRGVFCGGAAASIEGFIFVDSLESFPLSVEVWEATPKLEHIAYGGSERSPNFALMQPLIEAMNRGVAFQRLQKQALRNARLAGEEWGLLLGALAGAACTSQLTYLAFSSSKWPPSPWPSFRACWAQQIPHARNFVFR